MSFPSTVVMECPILGDITLNHINDNDGGLYRKVTATHLFQRRIRQSTMKTGRRRWNVEDTIKLFAVGDAPEVLDKVYTVREFDENNLDYDACLSMKTFLSYTANLDRLNQGET